MEEKIAQTFNQTSTLSSLLDSQAVDSENTVAVVDSAGYEATTSADLQQSLADLELGSEDISIAPDAAYVKQYLEVNGTAHIKDSLAVNNYLVMGDGLKMVANTGTASIDYVSPENPERSTLYLQSSGLGRINLMAGVMTIDNSGQVAVVGDLSVIGDAQVKGDLQTDTLLTNLIEADDYDEPTQIKLGAYTDENGEVIYGEVAGDTTESAEVKHSNLEIIDERGVPVATISAAGRAEFSDGLSIGQEDLSEAEQDQITTDKSSGRARIEKGQEQIAIKSSKITDRSQVFVTPLGSTNNQVLYIKSQTPNDALTDDIEGEFIVGFDRPAIDDVVFNWWIVN